MGSIMTVTILISILLILSLCLALLWRSASAIESPVNLENPQEIKASVIKIQKNYSPLDYPRGSIHPVVSNYAVA